MQGYDRQAWAFAIAHDADVGAKQGAPSLGVKALMLAILEDAIRAYFGPLTSSQREASFWITDARKRWVFSFPVVCETLGLEPDAVRTALIRMHARSPMVRPMRMVGRSRPNVRRWDGSGGRRPRWIR